MNGTNFTAGAAITNKANIGWRALALGDFDNNNSADIVFQNSTGQTAVWLMQGRTRLSSMFLNAGKLAGTGWGFRGVTDVDGDTKLDVVFQRADGALMIWFMNGTTFVRSAILPATVAPSWTVRAMK